MPSAPKLTQISCFPTEQELELFKLPRSKKDLIYLINRLKNSSHHYAKKFRFVYSGVSSYVGRVKKPKKQPVVKFYFNCCGLKPRLVFRQSAPEHYVLDQVNSSFIHEHPLFQTKKTRVPEGCKKHRKKVQKEKMLSPRHNSLEQEIQVKFQEINFYPDTLNSAFKIPHTNEKTPPQIIDLTTESQNILQNGNNKSISSEKNAQISSKSTQIRQTPMQSPQIQQDLIIFSTRYNTPQQNREKHSDNFSLKKKIFKSRIYFSNKSNRQILLNRPWIFKPSNKSNWLQKSMRQIQQKASQQQVKQKQSNHIIQIEQTNLDQVSRNQLFQNNSQKSSFSFKENTQYKQKIFYQQKTNQCESCSNVLKEKITGLSISENYDLCSLLKKNQFQKNEIDLNRVQLNSCLEDSNFGVQDPTVGMPKAVYHTFEWYKKFTQKLFQQKIKKPLNKVVLDQIKKQLQIEKPFSKNPTQNKEFSRKFSIFWDESNYLLLKANNLLDFDIRRSQQSGKSYQKRESKFTNKIFISKKAQNSGKDKQNFEKSFSETVFLGMYPIKLSGFERPLEILIAYQISTKLEAKLVWFSIFEETTQESKKRDKIIIKDIIECLLKSIEFMKLSKVRFIYTSLSKRLIWGLYNAMKRIQQMDVSAAFSFSMHASCIRKLLDLEKNITQNFIDFLTYIKPQMNDPKHKANIEKSKLYFENLIKNADQQKFNSVMNPREIFQHFKSIRSEFHALPFTQSQNLDISFLNRQFYPEGQNFQIKDPVYETNEALTWVTTLNGFEEFLPLLLTIFSTNFHQCLKIVDEHLIVPSKFMWKENQLLICHQIFNSLQNNFVPKQLFKKLFNFSVLDLESLVKKCPRLVTQTLYRLIYFSSMMRIIDKNDYVKKEQLKPKSNGYVVKNSIKQLQVNVDSNERFQTLNYQKMYPNQSQICEFLKYSVFEQLVEQKVEKISEVKQWNCECKFYDETGIPCEHEICCAITFKTSIYNEINKKWK